MESVVLLRVNGLMAISSIARYIYIVSVDSVIDSIPSLISLIGR